jgi:PAS domain S-box-containing protein
MPWPLRNSAPQRPYHFPADPGHAAARRQIVLFTAVLVILSGVGLVAALVWLRSEASDSADRLTESLAHVIEEQTSRTFQTADQRLQLAASRLHALDAASELNAESAHIMLREQIQGLPFMRAIWVLDQDGRMAFDSDTGNASLRMQDREYFQVYRQKPATEFHISAPVRSRSTGGWLISVSRPLRDGQGKVTGVIVAAVEPPYFNKLWREIDLGPDGAVAMFRRDGVLMMRTPIDDAAMGKSYAGSVLFTEHLAQSAIGTRVVKSAFDGKVRTVSYRTMSAYPGFVLTVGRSQADVLASWTRLATLSSLVWLTAAVTVILLSAMLHRQLVQRQRTEVHFRRLAQAMPQIVFITSAGGRLIFVSEQWHALTGSPVQDVLDKGWHHWIHPDDRDISRQNLEQTLATGVSLPSEHRLLSHDGSYRWHLSRAVANRDAAGRIASWYGTSTDIDDLKQAEQEMRTSLQTLQRASEAAQAIMQQRSLESLIQEVAQRARDVLGAHRVVVRLSHANGRPQSLMALSQAEGQAAAMPAPGAGELALPLTGRDGGTIGQLEVTGKHQGAFTAHDEFVAAELAQLASTAIDNLDLLAQVTELNTGLEEKIARRTAELSTSNAELEAFSYSVSHDLRSPLGTIDGFSRLLAGELDDHQGARVRHYLERIQAGVGQMGQLIDGLLSLAHVSRVALRRTQVDLSAMAVEIMERMQANHPGRTVAWNVEPGLLAQGDDRLLRSVLENLLGNAWKFSARVQAADVSLGYSGLEGAFFVRDNGAGFDMAYADKLFGAFQRLHDAGEFPGTGIGLATVARVLARHGGRIWAVSAPDEGATFYFTLPSV